MQIIIISTCIIIITSRHPVYSEVLFVRSKCLDLCTSRKCSLCLCLSVCVCVCVCCVCLFLPMSLSIRRMGTMASNNNNNNNNHIIMEKSSTGSWERPFKGAWYSRSIDGKRLFYELFENYVHNLYKNNKYFCFVWHISILSRMPDYKLCFCVFLVCPYLFNIFRNLNLWEVTGFNRGPTRRRAMRHCMLMQLQGANNYY